MVSCWDHVAAVLGRPAEFCSLPTPLFLRSLGSQGPGRLTQKVSKTCEP